MGTDVLSANEVYEVALNPRLVPKVSSMTRIDRQRGTLLGLAVGGVPEVSGSVPPKNTEMQLKRSPA